MPYYIAVYDVAIKRGPKMLKLFRRYLHWVQNSVFEGELTKAQFAALRQEAEALMNVDEDGILIYQLRDERYVDRVSLGTEQGERSRIL